MPVRTYIPGEGGAGGIPRYTCVIRLRFYVTSFLHTKATHATVSHAANSSKAKMPAAMSSAIMLLHACQAGGDQPGDGDQQRGGEDGGGRWDLVVCDVHVLSPLKGMVY